MNTVIQYIAIDPPLKAGSHTTVLIRLEQHVDDSGKVEWDQVEVLWDRTKESIVAEKTLRISAFETGKIEAIAEKELIEAVIVKDVVKVK